MFLAVEWVCGGREVGSAKIRRARDPEKTRRYFEHGETARELIGSVSFTYIKVSNVSGQRTRGECVVEARQ